MYVDKRRKWYLFFRDKRLYEEVLNGDAEKIYNNDEGIRGDKVDKKQELRRRKMKIRRRLEQ